MKLLIDIPEHIYEHAKEMSEDSRDEGEAMRAIANGTPARCMDEAEKERLIKKNMLSIENRVRNVFNQGYEMGVKESRSEIPNTCGDAVSRAIVQEEITKSIELKENPYQLWYRIRALPSVTPQQRTGLWEEYYTFLDPMTPRYRCSICQEPMEKILDGNQLVEWWSDYCPNCGAKMEVKE